MFNGEYIVPGVINYIRHVQLDIEPVSIREAPMKEDTYVLEDKWYYLIENAKPDINGCEIRPVYDSKNTTLPCLNKDGKLCFHPSFLNPTKYIFNGIMFEVTGKYSNVTFGGISQFDLSVPEPSELIRKTDETSTVLTIIDSNGRFYELHDDQICILCKPGKYQIISHGSSLDVKLEKATVPEGFADSVYITKA